MVAKERVVFNGAATGCRNGKRVLRTHRAGLANCIWKLTGIGHILASVIRFLQSKKQTSINEEFYQGSLVSRDDDP